LPFFFQKKRRKRVIEKMFNIFKSSTKEYEGKNFYSYSARNSNGEEISMSTYLGKVCMVVNVASQYEEVEHSALNFPTTGLADENFKQLAELDKRYRDQGLVIIGFPTNQFAGQEPAIQEEIISLIRRKYNVDFEIFQKVDVNGANTHPLFDYLKNTLPGTITNDIKWHFTKFLIDRNGNPVKRYAPNESPLSFEEEVRFLLKQESVLVKGMQAHLQSQQGQGIQEGQPPIGQAGLQGQIGSSQGQQQGKDWESKDWESKDWESKPSSSGGVDLQAQSLRQEKDLQGKGEFEQKNLNIGGGQGLQYQKAAKDDWGNKEEKNLNIGGGQGLQYQKTAKDDWGNKEEKNLNIGGGQGMYQETQKDWNVGGGQGLKYQTKPADIGEGMTLQQQIDLQNLRERELEEDHRRAAAEIQGKSLGQGQFQGQGQGQGMTLQEQIDLQNQRESELSEAHRRAAAYINSRTSGSSTVTAQAQALAQATKDKVYDTAQSVKDKVYDTAQAAKEKVVDTAQAMKEKVQDVTGMSQQQQPLKTTTTQQQPLKTTTQQQPLKTTTQQQEILPAAKVTTVYEKKQEILPVSERQQEMGFNKPAENLTGEGGVVGAQMGVHLGAHSVQAGVQAGKDPLKMQEQKK